MSILVSNAEKADYQAGIRDIHDTFARPLTGYKQTTIDSFQETVNYNYLFSEKQPEITITTSTVSGVFNARIMYLGTNNLGDYVKDIVINDALLEKAKGFVRLKLDKTGYDWIKDSKYIQFDDSKAENVSIPRRHGLFTPEYYTLLLKLVE